VEEINNNFFIEIFVGTPSKFLFPNGWFNYYKNVEHTIVVSDIILTILLIFFLLNAHKVSSYIQLCLSTYYNISKKIIYSKSTLFIRT